MARRLGLEACTPVATDVQVCIAAEMLTYTSLSIESKFMKRWEFDSIAQAAKGLMSWFPGTLYEALLLEHRLNYMIDRGLWCPLQIGKCEMKEENDIDAFVIILLVP
ncbi:hypothetical protein Tco_0158120 [Tanacetum coccineum]